MRTLVSSIASTTLARSVFAREAHDELRLIVDARLDRDAVLAQALLDALANELELAVDRLAEIDADHPVDPAAQIEPHAQPIVGPERARDALLLGHEVRRREET